MTEPGNAEPEAMKQALLRIATLTVNYQAMPLSQIEAILSDIHYTCRHAVAKPL